jgi:hypothetical protein
MTDARGRGIGHFVFACCCTWRKPDSVKRQTAVDGRSDRGDASPPDRTLRMNTGWPSSPSSTGKQSSVRCSEFHARHFATSMLGPDILSGHTLPPGDEDVGNHHPTGIAIQKARRAPRASCLLASKPLRAPAGREANPVASMVHRQRLGGTCPPRHEIRPKLSRDRHRRGELGRGQAR